MTTGMGGMSAYLGQWERGLACAGLGWWDVQRSSKQARAARHEVFRSAFVDAAVAAMNDHNLELRTSMVAEARSRFSWRNIVRVLVPLLVSGPAVVLDLHPTAPSPRVCSSAMPSVLVASLGAKGPQSFRRAARAMYACSDAVTWHDAQRRCIAAGMRLAMLRTMDDARALGIVSAKVQQDEGHFEGEADWIWLGLDPARQAWLDGAWLDGSWLKHAHVEQLDAACGALHGTSWRGLSCERLLPFACQQTGRLA